MKLTRHIIVATGCLGSPLTSIAQSRVLRKILKTSAGLFLRWQFITAALLASATLLRGQGQISDSAMAQIAALEQEKASRSPIELKLDSQFVFQLKQNRGLAIAAGVTQLKPHIRFETDGRVLVDIDATVTTNLLARIQQTGGTIIGSFPQFHSVRALVTIGQLESLAGFSEVKFIKRASKAHTNTGSVDSEGDAAHRADFARNNFDINGQGVKVGVLSDSIDYLYASQASGDLGDVTVLPEQDGFSGAGEGTAMLEIVHDLAPGAQLYFATAFNGEASFAQNILNLRSNGCNIIIDDVYYLDESPFQDGIIAQAVNAVTADGALYFSAAGNDGNLTDGTSGTWEGDFVDSGQPLPPGLRAGGFGGRVHSFGPTDYDSLSEDGGQGVELFWADPLGASTNDYDLFEVNGADIEDVSDNPQTGTQDPYEELDGPYANGQIVIVKSSGAARFLHLVAPRGKLGISTGGATRGHSAATNSFSVAAVDVHDSYPGPFTGGSANPVETFSSDGPRRVFFNANGSAITPGNFSSTGGAVRQKPDITAADGVMTYVWGVYTGYGPFYGTSAAAPHAGAIAALLWSYDPTLTPDQIRAALTNSALDIEGPGFDSNSGAGIVMAEQALETLPPRPLIVAGGAALVNESCPNGAIDPGETVTVALSLTNIGVGSTSNLVATLLETGGVTLASVPQSYGVLSPHTGTASQFFTFVATGDCGGTNIVTLQLQDGAMNLGAVSFAFRLGLQRIPLSENFDSVTRPNLPSGWSTASSGAGLPWQTVIGLVDTALNEARVRETNSVGDSSLISPLFHIYSSSAQMSFYQDELLSWGYSGGVLEISTNGGPYQDILDAGGSFVANGYNGVIYPGYGSPFGDTNRAAWTGYNGYFYTIVNLPASAAGQDVRLRWRFATDDYATDGYWWAIDSVQVTDGYTCCSPLADNVVVDASGAPNPVLLNGNLTYTINVENTGPGNATGVNVTDLLPPNFTLQSVSYSEGVYPGPGLNGVGTINFNVGTLTGGKTATITLSGTASAVGVITNRVSIYRTDGGLTTISNATVVTSVVLPSLSINDVSVLEDGTNAIFNVSLFPAPATNAFVRFATSNLTALATTNYFAMNGTLTFAPGVTNQTITVRVIDDLINAPDQTFAVNLSNPTNAIISRAQGIGTIGNVEPLPYLSVSDATVIKPNSGTTNATFNFRLSSRSGYSVQLDYSTSDGSAIAYDEGEIVDYIPTNNSLTFAPGQTNLSVRVLVTDHTSVKPSQFFNMVITWASDVKISRDTGVGTILTALPGQLDHFSWDAISSPQSNGLPFTATVRARDFFEGLATNFSGATALSSFVVNSYRTNNFLGSIGESYPIWVGPATFGYSFTPKRNMTVTHLRSYNTDRVSLWTEDGTLLASQYVTNTYSYKWVETPLVTPIQLQAGHTYRLGAYTVSFNFYYNQITFNANLVVGLPRDYHDAILGQEYSEGGDTFPEVADPGVFALVDVRYTVGIPTPLPITPTHSASFTNSAWSGLVTVQLPAPNVTLAASDGAGGHWGFSSPFDLAPTPGYATHFVWSPIASPEAVSNYFGATITAQDYFNNPARNFTGPVAISASVSVTGTRTNTMFGNVNASYTDGNDNVTDGESFTPTNNITVTSVRYYFGSKVSIWANDGTLLASTNVTSTPGTWQETALSTPLQLFAGQTYVIGAYLSGDGNDYLEYFLDGMPMNFPDGVINQSYSSGGDQMPIYLYFDLILVDIRYTVSTLTNVPVAVSPASSDTFTNGVWTTGTMLINRFATNLTLSANDGIGHLGLSNPFNVGYLAGYLDHFVWNAIPSPQTNAAPFAVTITGMDHFNNVATNFNGAAALQVIATPPAPSIAPASSGNFNQGLWTGSISLMPAVASSVVLHVDSLNHVGDSNPFNLVDPPLLPPLLQNINFTSNGFQFGWDAVPGHWYQVQYKTNLLQTNWLNLGSPTNATNVNLWLSQPAGPDPQRFFRVQLQ
jgi:uncharacterized repeat protein (TIGR01451 family)